MQYEPPLPLAEMLQCVSLSQDWVSVTQQQLQPEKRPHNNSQWGASLKDYYSVLLLWFYVKGAYFQD